MQQYLDFIRFIRDTGVDKSDRTGTGTRSVFGQQMRFNLTEGFPLVTTKKTHLKSIIHELIWFLKGETNIRYLKANGVSIWDEWIKPETAEYRPLTEAEMQNELTRVYLAYGYTEVKYNQTQLDDPDPAFWLVETTASDKETNEDVVCDIVIISYNTIAGLQELFKAAFEKDPQALLAGELGPVYGSQWRSWPVVTTGTKGVNLTIHERCAEANNQGDFFGELGAAYTLRGAERGAALNALSSKLTKLGIPQERREPTVNCSTIDQIANVIAMLKTNPDSRRLIVSAWNPAEVDQMALPPCHALFQFYTAPLSFEERQGLALKQGFEINEDPDGGFINALAALNAIGVPERRLDCQLYQRSADSFLGVPFNIASYALLVMMVAQVTNMVPGEFIWTGGDCHLYANHVEQVEQLLARSPLTLPTMTLNPLVKDIFGFTFDDFTLSGYYSYPTISAPIAV